MSTPINAILTGTFTSDGTALNLTLPSGYTEFEMTNITDIGSTAANTDVMKVWGTSSMAAGSAIYALKTSGAATIAIPSMTTTNGLTIVADSALINNGASVATTATTAATPAVVSTGTTTGLVASSSVVRIFNNTNMQQISSMDFTVGTISAGVSFQLKYLAAAGFAAAGTTGAYRIINAASRYYPRNRYITGITAASSAVITMSVTHGFTVGQLVRVVVPSVFGMTEINGLTGTVTAISTTNNTITVNIDSSGFTAFAFPTSATAAAGITFAQVVPVGEAATNSVSQPFGNLLDDATDNVSFTGVTIGTTVQTSGILYQWVAKKGLSV